MSQPISLRKLIDLWNASEPADPYEATEAFAASARTDLWPYAIVHEQVASGWANEALTSALALALSASSRPAHSMAALATLGARWPHQDVTAAINLLSLAHRATLTSEDRLRPFLSRAATACLERGLRDPRRIVAEEAVNVLGGLGSHHQMEPRHRNLLAQLSEKVIAAMDDNGLAALLAERTKRSLDSTDSLQLRAEDARRLVTEQWPWERLGAGADFRPAARLKTYLTALVWRSATDSDSAIQVVHLHALEPDRPQGWGAVDAWTSAIQSGVTEERERSPDSARPASGPRAPGHRGGARHRDPASHLHFEPLSAAGGSLVFVLRIDADPRMLDAVATVLGREDPSAHHFQFDVVSAFVRRHGLLLHATHVATDGTPTSVAIGGQAANEMPADHPRKVGTKDIPQANEVDRLFVVADCAATGAPITPAALDVTTERQVQYYKLAARNLGLLSEFSEELTATGWLLHRAREPDERLTRLRAAFEASLCGLAWIEWSNGRRLADVQEGTAERFLGERSELTGTTIPRRASTLERWLKRLRDF